jgi:plastocyanin domain-containing protein
VGTYKLWAQFQLSGEVVTLPFVLEVASGATQQAIAIPAGALHIRVTQRGYEPSRLEVPANAPVRLAFTRDSSPNCGSEVVFASLGVRRALPSGETVAVELPAQAAGDIAFSCAMGMYRGLIVAR